MKLLDNVDNWNQNDCTAMPWNEHTKIVIFVDFKSFQAIFIGF